MSRVPRSEFLVEGQTLRYQREQHLLEDDVTVRSMVIEALHQAEPKIQIADSMISGEILRDMNGASQVTITVHDYARAIVKSGALEEKNVIVRKTKKGKKTTTTQSIGPPKLRIMDVKLDGLWWRLTKVEKQGDDLVLTFEDFVVSLLRSKRGPKKVQRKGGFTRAEFIVALINWVDRGIPMRINQLHRVQPVAKYTKAELKQVKEGQSGADKGTGGFPDGTKVASLKPDQLRTISKVLKVAEKVNASERATLAMLVAGYGETGGSWSIHAHNNVGKGHDGVFQSDTIPGSDIEGQAYHFLKGGSSFREGGAIDAVRKNPDKTVGWIANYVEISDGGAAYYDSYFKKARKVLDAWGGKFGGGGSSAGKGYHHKPYYFYVNKNETYWDAIQRMAQEVQWRAFVVAETFYYSDELDLYSQKPRFRFSEDDDGVENIDFEWDYRRPVAACTATVRVDRYALPPGVTVQIEDLGPASNVWLVESVTRNLFDAEATVEMSLPIHALPEPKAELAQNKTGDGGDTPKNVPKNIRKMTPKEVIDKVILPIARSDGINVTAKSVEAANARHGPTNTGGLSDHQGPPSQRWAADMSNGTTTKEEDQLARDIADLIGIPWDGSGLVNHTRWGFRFQLIYRTMSGGNHYTHVHCGCRKE